MNNQEIKEQAYELLANIDNDNFSQLSVKFIKNLKLAKFQEEHRENIDSRLEEAQNLFGFHNFNSSEETQKQVKKEVNFLLSLLEVQK